jgi:acyl-coenzyme A synthetase/AMP-(fatty) acid ligase
MDADTGHFSSRSLALISPLNRAYIVADKAKITKEDIVKWLNGQVAAHKRLRGGVVFVEAIPKSPSGKILRKILREMVRKETPSKL